ncbi:DUF883 family protein [Paracoccus ravus]|uniref:DUF883 family protein n=1 Tax=Paracoccus ravus TaxID=2447760 RepID=UPI00106EBF55|nr:DUF883 family protein [Paracoccus ravus]
MANRDGTEEMKANLRRGAEEIGRDTRKAGEDIRENAEQATETLRNRGAEILETAREKTSEFVEAARGRSEEYAGQARDEARRLYREGERRAGEMAGYAEDYYDEVSAMVRRNPGQALGIAAGVGFLLGLIMARR